MNPQITTGALLSPHDYRDALVASAVAAAQITLPPTLNTQLGPVLMQGHIPACVSHSMVDILKLYWFIKTGVWIDFSPRFLDILSAESDIPLDGGRRPRTVLKVMYNIGCCTTATLPNDVTLSLAEYRDPSVITQAMKDEAAKYKIPGFINSPLGFQEMRQYVYYYGALSTLFSVGEQMYRPSWNPVDTDPLRIPNPVTSGHQMTVKGWDSPTFNLLRNEWSEAWANKGETHYDPGAWSPYIHEAWAIADIPKHLAEFLHSLPKSSDFHYNWKKDMVFGMQNEDIKFAQIALMILGFLTNVSADELGIFGPKTAKAVRLYQISKGIHPFPNSIGPRTRDALNHQFSI